jgi:SpoVK/Ycf46/Vps4 family AAA+-type ATPase
MAASDPVSPLREAIRLSPENLPLRKLLANSLLDTGRPDEAEVEFRVALDQAPDDPDSKIGLARAFAQQGKRSQAIVVLEDLAANAALTASQQVTLARLLLQQGLGPAAQQLYRRAIKIDPSAADRELAKELGVEESPSPPRREESEDDEPLSRFNPPRAQRTTWDGDADEETPLVESERPKLTFDDVGGLDEVKEQVRLKIILPMEHPELYAAYGKSAGGGMLLYGPPGCGKTYLARATAGETGRRFMAVGISDVLDMWIGNSERNLHAIFEQARRQRPCVLFFDEVDALAASRADMRTSAGRHLINQFLAELDGTEANNEGVLILAATNAPWHVDPAFRRPGRFDRVLFIPPPDQGARAAILRSHLRGKPQQDIDAEKVAAKTEGFSGADLRAVVDEAIEQRLREALKTGKPQPITTRDLLSAAKNHRPSTKEWFSTARNHALYANDAGQYDEIVKYLKM